MHRGRLTRLAIGALFSLAATSGVVGHPAEAADFVDPSLSATAEGGVTADGDTFFEGNGFILILPESQSCVSGTIEFSEAEAQGIRDEGLDPGRFAAIDGSGTVPVLTGASYLLNYTGLPVTIEEGDTVEIVTSLDVSDEFQTGPLPAGTYNFCLYGIYAGVAGYLFDGLETTIGQLDPSPTTTVAPTTTTTPEVQATPRFTG